MTQLLPSSQHHPRVAVSSTNADDPAFIVHSGTGYDGVVGLGRGGINCTGALLAGDGRHILTAAHCFNHDDETANLNPNPAEYTVFFDLPTGRVPVAVEAIFVHPNWTFDAVLNNDVAILKLAQTAPEAADRYELYPTPDEMGKTIVRVGYGVSGTGFQGQNENDFAGIKRIGRNRYDALTEIFNSPQSPVNVIGGAQWAYDFDSGQPANDAFGREFGIVDLGVPQEVGASSGDSGSPSFIDGKIAGVVSNGFSPLTPGIDFDGVDGNVSFGEYSVDTRTFFHAGYIAQTLAESRSGDDRILGTNRNDLLFGNRGNDTIFGLGGDDIALGGGDRDVISGGDGNDGLGGNTGSDIVNGEAGNDTIFGGQDDDTLTGGVGNDVLSGDLGNDLLTGGEGSDRFDVRATDGIDIITDFTDGQDLIGLKAGLIFAELSIAQVGNDTVLTSVRGLSITLQWVNISAIGETDFIIV
ncbi:MAG: trypsin-like serine protease [Geitlerinemataceae cyanobacterium]